MAKKQISTYKFIPGAVPPAYNQFPNAVSLLVANRAFLLEEIDAYITQEISASNPIYSGYTYDATRQEKCKRDIGYILDGFIYDLTYGGNTLTYQVASRYYVNGILQIIQPAVEIDVKTWLLGKITTNILPEVTYARLNTTITQSTITGTAEAGAGAVITTLMGHITDVITSGLSSLPTPIIPNQQGGGLMPNTVALIELNKRFIQEEAIAYIQYNVDNNNPPYTFYTYNAAKCRRDISYVLEGYLTDLRNGGNRQTVFNSEKYFASIIIGKDEYNQNIVNIKDVITFEQSRINLLDISSFLDSKYVLNKLINQ
jgi:predicted DNA-binding transcriptional regulator AlpA